MYERRDINLTPKEKKKGIEIENPGTKVRVLKSGEVKIQGMKMGKLLVKKRKWL